jgi:hypothetical protein
MSLLELILNPLVRNPELTHEQNELSLFFKPYDTPIAKKWLKLLVNANTRGLRIEPYYLKTQKVQGRFVGFPAHEKNAHDLAHLINQSIAIVNAFRPGAIPMAASETTQQPELNALHKYFEEHRGEVHNPAELFRSAPYDVQVALEDFNLLIHEYETYLETTVQGTGSFAGLDINFMRNGTREPLAPEDYAYFDPAREFGGIYLHYCEVGKQVLDAYFNQDDIVGEDNVRPLQYVAASFDIFFGRSTKPSFELDFKKKFNAWLIDKGLDPRDPKLSIGYLKVGQLVIDNRLKSLSRPAFLDFISGHLDVKMVKVHE